MDFLDSVFRSLDEPGAAELAEVQAMLPKRAREKAALVRAAGRCDLCEEWVGTLSLKPWPRKADGSMLALCVFCCKVINKDTYLIDYVMAVRYKWRDRVMYEALEKLKTKEQKARWKKDAARKRKAAKEKVWS